MIPMTPDFMDDKTTIGTQGQPQIRRKVSN